jgi:hypothetical protein
MSLSTDSSSVLKVVIKVVRLFAANNSCLAGVSERGCTAVDPECTRYGP